ncbi:MAG: gamma-glutamylcyclotransferase family protein, partial [Acidobacteriota bacterium]
MGRGGEGEPGPTPEGSGPTLQESEPTPEDRPDGALFVYGELCRAEVLLRVLGRIPVAAPALLLEHRRRRNPDTGYYEVYRSPDGYVAGLLLSGLADDELERLDTFEDVGGGLYRR